MSETDILISKFGSKYVDYTIHKERPLYNITVFGERNTIIYYLTYKKNSEYCGDCSFTPIKNEFCDNIFTNNELKILFGIRFRSPNIHDYNLSNLFDTSLGSFVKDKKYRLLFKSPKMLSMNGEYICTKYELYYGRHYYQFTNDDNVVWLKEGLELVNASKMKYKTIFRTLYSQKDPRIYGKECKTTRPEDYDFDYNYCFGTAVECVIE
jgi:hypothetical protein